jgi:nucleoside-diphosphate-sugar epimerase
MNILITGNAGFIGGYLTRKLISLGHTVRGLDINPDNPQSKICECIVGDICDKETVMRAMKGMDIVINLAAKHHDFGISEKEYFDVNEGGTRNLAECAAQFNVKKFVFYSSVAVYGTQAAPPTEESVPNLPSPYGSSKLAGEKALENWAKEDSSREVLVIRPVVVFGPENYANMYSLIRQIMDKKFIFIGRGDNIKSIAYVENLIEATTFLLNRLKPGMEYCNYVDEPQMTIRQIVNTISRYGGVKIPNIHFPLSLAVVLASPFDILEKITGRLFRITAKRIKKFNTETHFKANKIRETGFKQPITLEEGLRRTVEWFKNDKMTKGKACSETS